MAGVDPLRLDEMTLAEALITIEAFNERERLNLLSRIGAILRALSKGSNPFKGLLKPGESGGKQKLSLNEATRRWFWAGLEGDDG